MNYIKRKDFLKSTLSLGTLFFVPAWGFRFHELPNVLIIGDSISMGYTPFVKQILEDKAQVSRPNGNCGPTERGVANLDTWLGDKKYKVIYFNFGLHDLKHVDPLTKEGSSKAEDPVLADLNTYAANLTNIVERLEATGAKLIFATTTPVPANSGAPLREPDMPKKYNKVAQEVMKKHQVTIDDLFNYALPQIKEIQIPNNVHYTKKGSAVLAKRVAATISKYL